MFKTSYKNKMKNKYQLRVIREARMSRLNSFIMNEFCLPLKIPKIIFNKIRSYLKFNNYKFIGHKPVYQWLEVNECLFKSSRTSKSIVRI